MNPVYNLTFCVLKINLFR